MAIAYDNKTIKTLYTGAVSSTTFSHTTSGNDRVLLVLVYKNNSTSQPSSVTYGGTSLTLAVSDGNSNNGTNFSIWYLINPLNGANNIVVNFGQANYGSVVAVSFTGANEVKNGTYNNGSGNKTSSLTITSESGNICVSVYGSGSSNQYPVVGSGQTELYVSGSDMLNASSYKSSSSPSTTMTYTHSGESFYFSQCGVEIVSGSQTPPGSSKFFQLF